jgi:ATP-dependent DNA helicase RecG
MALPVNIDDLVNHRKVECARIEYKEGWNPEKVLHTLCAFANDIDNWGGGYVILGVAEKDGKPMFPVKGLQSDSIDKIQKELLGVCHLIEPLYLPVVEPIEYQGKTLLVIWAPGGDERPYACPDHILKKGKSPKSYFIRKMSSTVKASRAAMKELFELSGDVPFDDRPNMQAAVTDLKVNLMADYLREIGSDLYPAAEGMSPLELGKRLRIVRGAEENVKPLNVGLLFFNPHPEDFFRYAWIEVVDKPDPTGQGMTEKYFKGPLHVQLREALAFIKNYVLQEKVFKLSDRAEAERHWNYPYVAIEEALANAVYHKSYRKPEPIVVTFTPDRMEINSLPGPDRSIRKADLEKFRLFAKQDRNRRIGDFLKELELAEARNTGYPAILRAVERNGSPKPIIETNASRDYFTFVLPIHKYFRQSDAKTMRELNATDDPITVPVTDPVPTQYRPSTVPVTDPVRKLLSALKNGPCSPSELRVAVGIKHRQTFRGNYLNPALKDGLICLKDGISPHDPNVRYSLTDMGLRVLNETVSETVNESTKRPDVTIDEALNEGVNVLSSGERTIKRTINGASAKVRSWTGRWKRWCAFNRSS